MKKNRVSYYLLAMICFLLLGQTAVQAQQKPRDSINLFADSIPAIKDSATGKIKKGRSPRVAAIRSAILPGLGQIYNRKYWKLPLVYGALGATGGIFVFNLQWYKRTRFAYRVLVNNETDKFNEVHPKLRTFVTGNKPEPLRYYRDSYRKDIDYSAVFFLIAWGLNVVDASVDAHLSTFDVSPDLSFKIQPGYSDMAGTTGLSLVLKFK